VFSIRPSALLLWGLFAFLTPLAWASPRVVAAENFYGNIASQLGGESVIVTSLLSDPNVDPHEYESSVAGAKAVARADLVIENSGGYDDWMDKLLGASPNPRRIVLKAFDLAVHRLPDNEHVWYDPANVGALADKIVLALKTLDPAQSSAYERRLRSFQAELLKVSDKMATLRARFVGVPAALTETLFLYQADLLGLRILTPFEFQKAVAEGEDPPASLAVVAENQIKARQVRVLVFNLQTVTPETDKLRTLAASQNIPVVGVTETMPRTETYQTWMLRQLDSLQSALQN